MKVAVIGSGISGLTCANLLSKNHHVEVFEAENRIGGHTATIDTNLNDKNYKIDTGFIVFNERTYPNFISLLKSLNVDAQPSSMSFSVNCPSIGLEYAGNSINSLFSQRSNIFRPSHWRMIKDILRFNDSAKKDLESGHISSTLTLIDYLQSKKYGKEFIDYYIIPMGSAIWSSSAKDIMHFPLEMFLRFFKNHGLLDVLNKPQWFVVKGGSSSYLAPLVENFKENIFVNHKVSHLDRGDDGVTIHFESNKKKRFDQVVLATHSDQTLKILGESASWEENDILSSIPYTSNEVILHTDETMLPKSKLAWSSWNYKINKDQHSQPTLSYNMNILQNIQSETTFIVTLNDRGEIDPDKILNRFSYAHPQFTSKGESAKKRWEHINGKNRTWFCGAYWSNGFHEDGCKSGIRVAEAMSI